MRGGSREWGLEGRTRCDLNDLDVRMSEWRFTWLFCGLLVSCPDLPLTVISPSGIRLPVRIDNPDPDFVGAMRDLVRDVAWLTSISTARRLSNLSSKFSDRRLKRNQQGPGIRTENFKLLRWDQFWRAKELPTRKIDKKIHEILSSLQNGQNLTTVEVRPLSRSVIVARIAGFLAQNFPQIWFFGKKLFP